ncbi:MAG: YajQ family cyclic di-GMP-binding protein [Bacteroidota bacterium]
MAETFSFDIVSEVNMQEVDNALNQARKEIIQRFDFKGSKTTIDLNQKEKIITLISDDEYKMKAVIDIIQLKMIKRNVSLKALQYSSIDPAAGGTVRLIITLQAGIGKDQSREIVKLIKETKLKVQAAIQDQQVRVSGKNKDDLQAVMKMLKDADLHFAMQFTNYR